MPNRRRLTIFEKTLRERNRLEKKRNQELNDIDYRICRVEDAICDLRNHYQALTVNGNDIVRHLQAFTTRLESEKWLIIDTRTFAEWFTAKEKEIEKLKTELQVERDSR